MLQRPFRPGDTIVFEGDSMSSRRMGPLRTDWPYLRLMGWDRVWGDVLAELLFCWYPELKLDCRNTAIGGSKSHQLVDRFDTHVRPFEPDWVLFTMCGNDVAVGRTPDETAASITRYVELCREVGAQAVWVGGFIQGPHSEARKREQQARRSERDACIREALAAAGGHALDVGAQVLARQEALCAMWQGHRAYCGDGDGHYNQIGATIIAGEVLRALGYLNPLDAWDQSGLSSSS